MRLLLLLLCSTYVVFCLINEYEIGQEPHREKHIQKPIYTFVVHIGTAETFIYLPYTKYSGNVSRCFPHSIHLDVNPHWYSNILHGIELRTVRKSRTISNLERRSNHERQVTLHSCII